MSDVVISARGLGKRYLIGHETVDRSQTFRERIMAGAGGLARNLAKTVRGEQLVQGKVEEFWALRDVDFDIRRGDTVGIIGRNGAGKSTLLKILSRNTEPTTGRVDIRGRVASLLEVGTGFHPELTGRENIFLNGAILGMSRAEIRRKLDEIVDFAGVERFLDTPVKRYSSGMGVRLGFSVAAHLEPEILVVDEVLAVGDAEFQRKCLGKMQDVASGGRTVLFVSHNLASVQNLCNRGMLLLAGQLKSTGTAGQVLDLYQRSTATTSFYDISQRTDRAGTGDLRFTQLEITSPDKSLIRSGSNIDFTLHFLARRHIPRVNFSININDAGGSTLMKMSTVHMTKPFEIDAGAHFVKCSLQDPRLLPGTYYVTIAASMPPGLSHLDLVRNAAALGIETSDIYGTGHIPDQGAVYPIGEWSSAVSQRRRTLSSSPA